PGDMPGQDVVVQAFGRGLGRWGVARGADVEIWLDPATTTTKILDRHVSVGLQGLADISCPVRLYYEVLEPALLEATRLIGLTSLHAACVQLASGWTVLLLGGRGAGKSTTALALARAGATLLSDDTVFFEANDSPFTLCAFPRELHVPRQ